MRLVLRCCHFVGTKTRPTIQKPIITHTMHVFFFYIFFFFRVLQIVYENRSFDSVNIGAQTRVTRYRNTSEAISIIAKEYFKKEKNVHSFFFVHFFLTFLCTVMEILYFVLTSAPFNTQLLDVQMNDERFRLFLRCSCCCYFFLRSMQRISVVCRAFPCCLPHSIDGMLPLLLLPKKAPLFIFILL